MTPRPAAAVLLLLAAAPFAAGLPTAGGPTAPDGRTAVQADLPLAECLHNTGGLGRGGPGTGAGLCVFTSLSHSARYQNVDVLKDFQRWMTTRPGGGYPEKVDQMIAAKCQAAAVAAPDYVQYEGQDLQVLRKALDSGRMPAVTYDGRDGFYAGHVEHMVNLVYLDDHWAAILDNNREKQIVWMTPAEFQSRWVGGAGRQGWAVILTGPGCPPAPPGGAR